MVSTRYALFIIGAFLLILAATMLVPAAVDMAHDDLDWGVFLASGAATAFFGGMLVLTFRQSAERFTRRTGYLITVGSWVAVTAFGALPLWFSSLHIGITDAVFETMSALTTTGSTVLSGLDTMPRGILLWRSIMQWIGGLGIVAMAIILLPTLRIGGMQLFMTESSALDESGGSRLVRFASAITASYVGLTVLCAVSLVAVGMDPFDAINHAMTTLATGGFSTKDASVGYFNSVPIEVVIIVFMAAGALPLVFYAHVLMKGWSAVRSDAQIPTFLVILCGSILIIAWWLAAHDGMAFPHALRISAFNVTSVLTDTGFGSADFTKWGSFPVGMLFILMLIGGCAGSTAGSIKIFRWQILWKGIRQHLEAMLLPDRVQITRYADRPISEDMISSVRNFFVLYALTLGVLSLGLMGLGMGFLASFSSVAQAMANAGPGLTHALGPAGNFAHIPTLAKWDLTLAMLLGRLELSTVYVLFLGVYWRW